MVTHWGVDGNPDGWSSKTFAVIFLPLFMLGIHWIALYFTSVDPKNKGQNPKMFELLMWIVPLLSLVVNSLTYATAFEKEVNVGMVIVLIMGVFIAVIGNYMPKCKQNRTIGIRIKWTLENEENWNSTHRVAGRVWFIGGLLLIPCAFLPEEILTWTILAIMLLIFLFPFSYSYCFYRKQRKNK
jgi:uncharacterized membrane protein